MARAYIMRKDCGGFRLYRLIRKGRITLTAHCRNGETIDWQPAEHGEPCTDSVRYAESLVKVGFDEIVGAQRDRLLRALK